ncbi:NADH-ubiquinone oxidoreductase-F iron-sulfur binding region domain-containing protein [Pseudofrankia inefficax]|uniref:Respiratory-chain NADH dehydrogenase domain 51 kDa subunit n=1 Tax=Pseudofrankia inefficax (strain DSM 45817 / CECT 9037 / DDB 130130 / EuI1c) TaxID=298654 RepID=E3IWX3_PSEI1|nr:NADH-ubiquinone oxidoreductase-F iron-sulfur binding region domain-containing protein [Pseudofrankia inefficax]ADP82597.1 Respiratory-chain NADH dehydrogenase domain 51 kDa subunit [Pseudofrankia inefficax]
MTTPTESGPAPATASSPEPGYGGRLLAAGAASLADHVARLGPVPYRGRPAQLVDELRAAGLTGRGGAGFPMWRKLAAALGPDTSGGQAWSGPASVVANAAESEPESAKDAWLLTHAPHLVLDGLALVAEAVSAADAYVYVKPGPGAESAGRALAERRAARVDRRPAEVRLAPPGVFVAGEASAAAAVVDGGAAKPFPQFVPLAAPAPRGAGRQGRSRRSLVVCNAETLAHLALLARHGAAWFRERGTVDEPGTMLVTVGGAVVSPGLVEVPIGATLAEVVGLAGGAAERPGAIRVGGYGGSWLSADRTPDVPLSRAGLSAWDAAPGPGLVHVLPARACGLAETARLAGYLAAQSAGQCGPCRAGLPELAAAAGQLAGGGLTGSWARQAAEVAELVDGRGACRHPDGAARLVRSALRVFAADLHAHAAGRCAGSGS